MDLGQMYELLGGGDDDEGVDELGALIRAMRRPSTKSKRRSRRRVVKQILKEELTSSMPGIPKQGPLTQPLGFEVISFTAGSGTQQDAVARPQKPIKGNRLLVDASRSLADGSTTVLVTNLLVIDKILVGTVSQLAGTQPLTATGFGPGAFDTMLSLDAAQPGIDITLGYTISSPALVAAEVINVSAFIVNLTAG